MKMAASQYQRTLNMYKNGMVMQVKVDRSTPSQIKPKKYFKGVVKKILSGDAIIIRKLKGKGGPPPERQINFSNVIAPKLARRPTSSQSETEDEPCAWMAREFLRNKLIGKEIQFTVEAEAQSGREYGTVFLEEDTNNLINVTEMMVSEGLLTVRREIIRSESKLTQLEDAAKAQGKGKWRPDANTFVRDIKWSVGNLAALVDKEDGKPIKAIIEHVSNGSTVSLLLLPDYHHVTLMISGIKCQMFKEDPYAEEARYFIESRLLQRDVEVYLEMYNENNLVGTIKHPYGNIAELLLKEGYAKCVDWSMGTVTGGAKNLRSAEKLAKSQKLRMWTNYELPTIPLNIKEIEFQGKVTEVVNGNALFIKNNNGDVKKVFLSSIRPPRLDATENQQQLRARKSFCPLYDIPWLYEAREFLRQKLIGQKVHVTVDYIQPAQYNFQEKVCCTVKIGQKNVSQEMVRKGLASVVRHRQDDDQRSSCYDDLLSVEAKAIKDQNGLHSKNDKPIQRVTDISGDPAAAEYLLPILYEAGMIEAIVEFVASGSRMRLFIPREACFITFLLEGITCPKAQRPAPGGAGTIPEEPFGAEALVFTKYRIFQRNVLIKVEKIDKGGNFIGWLHYGTQNLAVQLVKNGLSTVHKSAEGTEFSLELYAAERKAKGKKIKIWANFGESEKDKSVGETEAQRKIINKSMIICGVSREGLIFGQYCSDRPVLEALMNDISKELATRPPNAEKYSPRRGDLCAAQFVDGNWYRAKVESIADGKVNILYIDYGNQEITNSSKVAPLASQFISQPKCAYKFALALTKFPRYMYFIKKLISHLMSEYAEKEVKVNCEYKINGIQYCTVQMVEDESDVVKTLLSQGLLLVEKRKDQRLQGLLSEYYAAQDEARRKELNIWQPKVVYDD